MISTSMKTHLHPEDYVTERSITFRWTNLVMGAFGKRKTKNKCYVYKVQDEALTMHCKSGPECKYEQKEQQLFSKYKNDLRGALKIQQER